MGHRWGAWWGENGKVRAIGASNVSLDSLKECVKYGELDVIQEK